jgi:hypothetical protein
MEASKKVLTTTLFSLLVSTTIFSQTDLMFGTKKIKVPGKEVCNYTVNKNSHIAKDYLDISNGILLYTVVEYADGKPVHIEMTECKLADLDKANCSLGASDQKSLYTPGQIYILYLYTLKDQVNISTTVYESPEAAATIMRTSVSRLHFRDHLVAENYYESYFK